MFDDPRFLEYFHRATPEPELRRLRCKGAPAVQIDECQRRAAEQIVAAVREAAADGNIERQIDYYRSFANLRFAYIFEDAPVAAA